MIAWGRAIVSSLLSEPTRARLRPVLGARPVRRPWIQPAFAARTSLADRLRPRAALPFPTREQQNIYRGVTSLVQILGDEMEERAAQAVGLEQRHPLYDRRVAEFGLAVPVAQRSDGDAIKVVFRRARRRLSAADRRRADFARRQGRVLLDVCRSTRGAWWPRGIRPPADRRGRLGRRCRHPADVRRYDSALQRRRRHVHCQHPRAVGRGSVGTVARRSERRRRE